MLAELSGLSVPTIQRMEASDGVIRGNVDSLMKLIAALDQAGIELIGEGARQPVGRARRQAEGAQERRAGRSSRQRHGRQMMAAAPVLMICVALFLATAVVAVGAQPPSARDARRLRRDPCRLAGRRAHRARRPARRRRSLDPDAAARPALDRRAFPASMRCPPSSCSSSISAAPPPASTRSAMAPRGRAASRAAVLSRPSSPA